MTGDDAHARDTGQPHEHTARWLEHDRALARFEDYLASLPLGRALPDVATLAHAAGIDPDLVRRDDRARKLLDEAVLSRPYADPDAVSDARTEVELLTLEVAMLTEQLADLEPEVVAARRARRRLREVRARLDGIRRGL